MDYIEKAVNKKAVFLDEGEPAPFNDEISHSINTELAESIGFHFTPLKEWIFSLIDFYIQSLI